MSRIKISDLPQNPAIALMKQLQSSGKTLLPKMDWNGEVPVLVGLCDLVRELQKRIEKLESRHD